MKILIIPDIHQTPETVDAIEKNIDKVDKVVLLGDIVDNWEADEWWDVKERNPLTIINRVGQLKRKYLDKIIWLLGNHDLSYLASSRTNQSVSGHQWRHSVAIGDCLRNYVNDIDVAVQLDKWVFSHAGFSTIWKKACSEYNPEIDEAKLIDEVNRSFHEEMLSGISLVPLHFRGLCGSGDDPEEGPLWIRPNSLTLYTAYKKQVVGHTECGPKEITIYKDDKVKNKILIIDNQDHSCASILDTKTDKVTCLSKQKFTKLDIKYDDIVKGRKVYKNKLKELKNFYKKVYGN